MLLWLVKCLLIPAVEYALPKGVAGPTPIRVGIRHIHDALGGPRP